MRRRVHLGDAVGSETVATAAQVTCAALRRSIILRRMSLAASLRVLEGAAWPGRRAAGLGLSFWPSCDVERVRFVHELLGRSSSSAPRRPRPRRRRRLVVRILVCVARLRRRLVVLVGLGDWRSYSGVGGRPGAGRAAVGRRGLGVLEGGDGDRVAAVDAGRAVRATAASCRRRPARTRCRRWLTSSGEPRPWRRAGLARAAAEAAAWPRAAGGVLDRDGEGQRADLHEVAVLELAGLGGQRLAVDEGAVAAAQVADR